MSKSMTSEEFENTDEPVPEKVRTPGSLLDMFSNPAARTYLMISGGGLLATCLLVFLFFNSMLGAIILFLIGVGGLLGRWSSAPPLFVLFLGYFAIFPMVVPYGEVFRIKQNVLKSVINPGDVLVLGCTLVYLLGSLRLYAITHTGMPFDAPKMFIKPKAKPTVRSRTPIGDLELWMLFARVGLFVLLGQVAWNLLTKLRVDFSSNIPVTTYPTGYQYDRMRSTPDILPSYESQFLLGMGAVALVVLVCSFTLYYLWLLRMNRDEATMVILDEAWKTSRRDYNRPEAWRGWQKKKLLGTLPRKGCGAWFLVIGVPILLVGVGFLVLRWLLSLR
jgi:hypothetical protein